MMKLREGFHTINSSLSHTNTTSDESAHRIADPTDKEDSCGMQ